MADHVERIPRRMFLEAAGVALALTACAKGSARDRPKGDGAISKGDGAISTTAQAVREMPRRPLGRTGETVSIVGLGGYHLGLVPDEAESVRIVRTAIERGVNFLDNCWDYHGGMSEVRMGKALADGWRKQAFLMTKIDGRTKRAAAEQIDQSLRRLGTDRIDLVQIHEVIRSSDPARCFAEGGCVEALMEAKRGGKLRFIGFTGHKDPEIHLAMLKAADEHRFTFDTVQMPLNVMDASYRSFEKRVLPVLVDRGIGVLGMKSLGAGKILESGRVSAIECLRYAMNLPTSTVITGCESMTLLAQAIEAATGFQPLSADEVTALIDRTRDLAKDGRYERFKTTRDHDGTLAHPEWLESA